MQTDTDTLAGMALRDHRLATSRLSMLTELSWVATDECAEIYGEDDPASLAAARMAEAAEALRQAMQAHGEAEHPGTQDLYLKPVHRPTRPTRPVRVRAGEDG